MNLTEYTALNVKMTAYSKVNNQFSIGRARVFYEGPNPNRTIFDAEASKNLIKTIPGTPIVGKYNNSNNDFEGHGEGQIAFGFVPLDPNPLKVEVTEEVLGLPVKKVYYEVDAVIWDGRFPEAKKILEEEKSLSMELNPDTLAGEIEIYDDKHYLKVTNAEFYGITVLGDAKTPCFKDAKFLQAYTNMLSAYEALEHKSNIGGTIMPETTETVVEVEVNETEATITNEEAPQAEETTEEVVATESENAEETPTEEGAEEGTEETTNEEEETNSEDEAEQEETEEETETEEVEENTDTSTEETEVEENTEAEENTSEENYELNLETMTATQKHSLLEVALNKLLDGEDFYLRDFDDNYVYVKSWEEGMFRYEYTTTNEGFVINAESKVRVLEGGYIEFSEGKDYKVSEIIATLENEVNSLNSKLNVYETAAKEELVIKFSSKINDSEFLTDVRSKISDYTVESLKATLGEKLAEQVLEEETKEENKGLVYSFNGIVSKDTGAKGWQELVRISKEEAANKK